MKKIMAMLLILTKLNYYAARNALLCVMGGLLAMACGQPADEINGLLAKAMQRVEQQPDSALHYLDAIQNPARLNKTQYADYHLLRIQAKDKAGQDISADTVICEVKDWFLRKKDFEKATLAAFYEGCVFGKDNKRALQAFLEAETVAEHIADARRKGLIQHNIGGLYYAAETNYEEAIIRLKKAAGYFQAGNYYKYSIASLNLLGTCFLLQEQADSALFYQQQSLDIAVTHADTAAWTAALQNISVTCREKGNSQQAKAFALAATGLNKANGETINALLNLSYIYYDCAQYDSAAFYANRILQYGNVDSACAIPLSTYYLLAKIAENENDYRRALEYTNKYQALADERHKKQEDQSLAGIRERYELELAQIEKQIVAIRASRKHLAAFLVAVMSIIAVLACIIGYIRYKKRFIKAKKDIDRLYNLRIDWVKKQELIEHALKTTLKDEEVINTLKDKIYKSLYENDVWEMLYTILNERHNGAIERLQQQLSLSDQSFQICCFAYAGFSDKEIATCLQLSPNTVKSKKSAIRKQLKVAERGSIKKFITQKLQDKTSL
jgi:DNA-binding CsgD family transcriptional regulator